MFLDMIIMMNDDKNVITIYILYFTHVTLSINVLSLNFEKFSFPSIEKRWTKDKEIDGQKEKQIKRKKTRKKNKKKKSMRKNEKKKNEKKKIRKKEERRKKKRRRKSQKY